ncbi:MAG TPA: nuclear transport factor 2 family protein [Pseudolysinimonas sp.]|jgi:hypothetical protein
MTVASADESAARDLVARIAHAMDTGPLEELLALMHPEVTMSFAANPAAGVTESTIPGRDAVSTWVASRRDAGAQGPGSGTRHFVANQLVSALGDGRIRSLAYFAYLAPGAAGVTIRAMGSYDDELERGDGGWLLRARTVRP